MNERGNPEEEHNNGFQRRMLFLAKLVVMAVALGLLVYEAVLRDGDPRPALLVIYAAMLGLSPVINLDNVIRGHR